MKKIGLLVLCILLIIIAISLAIFFKPSKITIKFMDGDEIINEMEVEKGDIISLPQLTKENYLFAGWYYKEQKLNKSVWFNHDAILTASWEEQPPQMTITYNTKGGREIAPSVINCNSSLNLPVPYKENYIFVSWLDASGNVINNETKLNCEDIILNAKWQRSSIDYDQKKSSYHSLSLEAALADVGIPKKFSGHTPNSNAITIYLFYGKECRHCHEFLAFMNTITAEYGQYFKMEAYEVWNNANNAKLMGEASTSLGEKATAVPYIIIGEKTFQGYSSGYDDSIKTAIMSLYNTPTTNRYDMLEELNIN